MEQPWRAVRDEAAAYGQWERGKHLGGHCSGIYAAKHCQTGERAVLKKLPLQHEDEGVPGCMLREVSLLKELHHPNVVQLKDVFFLPSKTLYLLFEWCDYDLKRVPDAEWPGVVPLPSHPSPVGPAPARLVCTASLPFCTYQGPMRHSSAAAVTSSRRTCWSTRTPAR